VAGRRKPRRRTRAKEKGQRSFSPRRQWISTRENGPLRGTWRQNNIGDAQTDVTPEEPEMVGSGSERVGGFANTDFGYMKAATCKLVLACAVAIKAMMLFTIDIITIRRLCIDGTRN